MLVVVLSFFFFFQAEDGIRDGRVTGVQTCALPICSRWRREWQRPRNAPGPATTTRTTGRPSSPMSPTRPMPRGATSGSKRSEERRVGKECRSRWAQYHEKKKIKKYAE